MRNNHEKSIGAVHLADPRRWVTKYADFLYTYALSRINDEEVARDLVQDTFLAALEKLDRFEGRSTEGTWLTAILKNKIIDIYRQKSSGPNVAIDAFNLGNQQPNFFDPSDGHWNRDHRPQSMAIDGDDPMLQKELAEILHKCMHKLPALWLSVFSMKHLDEESTDLICTQLKVTPAHFWVIMHRAKLNLRDCLQKNWL